jgi:hypothetical protein
MTRTRIRRLFRHNSVPRAASDIVLQLHNAIDGYATSIVPLLRASYGSDCVQQAWREFTLNSSTLFTVDDAHCELFFSWLFHCWSPAPERDNHLADTSLYGQPPTRTYLARQRRLNPLLRRYLEACLETSLGFYEVAECRPNISFRVEELSTRTELEVIDRVASTSLTDGDIVFARIPCVDGISIMDAISPVSFPPSFRTRVSARQHTPESRKLSDLSLRTLYFELLETGLWRGRQRPAIAQRCRD